VTAAVERLRATVACLVLTSVVFAQDAGRVVPDTKLDLTVDPAGLMARALSLWDPEGGAGQLQNQAYGYLFPMGPVMWLLQAVGLPDWAAQRVWQSLVLCTALLGVRALAARLELGSPGTRLLAGAAYALAARPLSQVGEISVEVWPMALAPWVLVPLVTASRGGSPRRAAARSGLALLLAGGVNGAATLAVVPLGVVWLLVQSGGRARRRLAAWWAGALLCATAWWLGPLLLLGRYSPPFLDVIESAAVTTRQNGLWAVLTGNDLWLQYLALGAPARPAGHLLVTEPSLVVSSTAVAALGVLSLVRRDTPYRRFLTTGALLGVLLLAVGYAGPLGSPLAATARDLLDGPLAAFRNVHKYDPVLRLPLALGLAHVLAAVVLPRRARLVPQRPLAALAALAVLGAASPALGQLQPQGSWTAVPAHWQEVADYLAAASGPTAPTRALLVPAAHTAAYSWGRPADEPLQALARSPWAVRDAVPLGGPGVTRVLDTVEEVLRTGRGSPALAAYLARAGVRHLVVRNDLDPTSTDAVRPSVVHASLGASPGLRRVAAFGPLVGAGSGQGAVVVDGQLDARYPAVEVFEVAPDVRAVTTWPRAGTQRVSGGPESVLPLLEQGLLVGTSAVRLAGEAAVAGEDDELRTVTDGYRRREVDMGRAGDGASATLGGGARARADRPVHDYFPVPPERASTTALAAGLRRVTASSSAADAESFLVRGRDHHAMAAFDGDGATSWVSGGLDPRGQWVEAAFTRRVVRSVRIEVAPLRGTLAPTRVRISTDEEVRVVPVLEGAAEAELGRQATRLRVTVLAVEGQATLGVTTLEVSAHTDSGLLRVERGLRAPDDAARLTGGRPADSRVAVLMSAGRRDRPGCLPVAGRTVCSPALPLGDEDDPAVDTTFALDHAAVLGLSVSGRVRAGAALEALLQRGQPLTVSATSTAVADPGSRPAAVVDGDARTSWLASDLDPAPRLTLRLAQPRRLVEIRVFVDPHLPASRPQVVSVRVDGGAPQVVALTPAGLARIQPVTGTQVEVTFPEVEPRHSLRRDGFLERLPVGVSELVLVGPGPRLRQQLDLADPVGLACGRGPLVAVDGVLRAATRVRTTVGELLGGGPVRLEVCTGALELTAGAHRLRAAATDLVQVTDVRLVDLARPAPKAGTSRVAGVGRWERDHRSLQVGPGEEAWLVVHESFNRGWQAELDGERLTAARLDGWQQGFLLPAGSGGDVVLRFAPDRLYRVLLGTGAVLALVLLAGAVLPGRTPRAVAAEPVRGRRGHRLLGASLGALALALLAGWAGPAALLAVWAVRRRRPDAVPLTAAAALLLAGALVALRPWPSAALTSAHVQALCLVAVAALVVALLSADPVPRREAGTTNGAGPPSPPGHGGLLHEPQAGPGDEHGDADDRPGQLPEVAGEGAEAQALEREREHDQVEQEDAVRHAPEERRDG